MAKHVTPRAASSVKKRRLTASIHSINDQPSTIRFAFRKRQLSREEQLIVLHVFHATRRKALPEIFETVHCSTINAVAKTAELTVRSERTVKIVVRIWSNAVNRNESPLQMHDSRNQGNKYSKTATIVREPRTFYTVRDFVMDKRAPLECVASLDLLNFMKHNSLIHATF